MAYKNYNNNGKIVKGYKSFLLNDKRSTSGKLKLEVAFFLFVSEVHLCKQLGRNMDSLKSYFNMCLLVC